MLPIILGVGHKEFARNYAAAEASILPAVLSDDSNNNNAIAAWLAKHATVNGIAPGDVASIKQAIVDCHRANLLTWKVPPGSARKVHENPRGEDSSGIKSSTKAALDEMYARNHQAANEKIAEALTVSKQYVGAFHSATARGKEALKQKMEELIAPYEHKQPSYDEACTVLAEIKKFHRTLP